MTYHSEKHVLVRVCDIAPFLVSVGALGLQLVTRRISRWFFSHQIDPTYDIDLVSRLPRSIELLFMCQLQLKQLRRICDPSTKPSFHLRLAADKF
jgi:hypothetical protein